MAELSKGDNACIEVDKEGLKELPSHAIIAGSDNCAAGTLGLHFAPLIAWKNAPSKFSVKETLVSAEVSKLKLRSRYPERQT